MVLGVSQLPQPTGEPAGHAVRALMSKAAERGLSIFDLGRPLIAGMPHSPNHPEFRLALQRRHGDVLRADGSSGANELIVTGGHVGTHIDALCHVAVDGRLHGGLDALAVQTGGTFRALGVETIPPVVCRGLLLDIPAALQVDACEGGYEITSDDLDAALARTGTEASPSDVLLIRTGWAQRYGDAAAYVGHDSGVPGPGDEGAHWLSARRPLAVGADTLAFEHLPPSRGHALLPAHKHLLVESGIYILETLDLEALAAAQAYEFLLVLAPLNIVGATGSPVRPLALVTPSDS